MYACRSEFGGGVQELNARSLFFMGLAMKMAGLLKYFVSFPAKMASSLVDPGAITPIR